MELADALSRLPAKAIPRVLETLHAIRQRATAGEAVKVPLATFHMRGSREFTGWLLDLGKDREADYVLIQLAPGDRSIPDSLSYLSVGDLSAITIHEAACCAHLFSFGRLDGPAWDSSIKREPVQRLELKRRLAAIGEELSGQIGRGVTCEAPWDSLSNDPDTNARIAGLLDDVAANLKDIAASSLGKDALRVVKGLRLIAGEWSALSLKGGVLQIPVTPKPDLRTRDQLRVLLEK